MFNDLHFGEVGKVGRLRLGGTLGLRLVTTLLARLVATLATIARTTVTTMIVAATRVAVRTAFATALTTVARTTAVATTRTGLALGVTLRLRKQHLVGKTVLAGLLINLNQLHLDLVTHLQHILHILDAAVGNLGDVQKTVGAGQELHESAKCRDGLDRAFVNLAHLGFGGDEVDALDDGIDVVQVGSCDVDDTSSMLMVVWVSRCISWIILPPGPMTAPMNSRGICIWTMRGTKGR